MLSSLKRISPNFIKTTARYLRAYIYNILNKTKPYLIQRRYCGYKLFHTRGAGLVERIRFGNPNRVYEHDLVKHICKELSKHKSPVFLDIGTNIGLISLSVLRNIPEVQIFGFEPGSISYKSFFVTIFANQIEERIKLYNEALNNKLGLITFYAHTDTDSSGDGMLNTGRAGTEPKQITVKSNTLDNWITDNNIPNVDVVKIDIEGAELYALQGSISFLNKYKPVIYLEISKYNLKVYPYTEKDILLFFHSNGYELFDLNNTEINQENISNIVEMEDTFMAKPKK